LPHKLPKKQVLRPVKFIFSDYEISYRILILLPGN
jgi:hypothetical protein